MSKTENMLAEVAELAAQLNASTDGLNETILAVEKGLADARVGMTVWTSTGLCETPFQLDRDRNQRFFDYWDLGYTKIEDAWRIAVRRMRAYVINEEHDEREEMALDDAIPLSRAPRVVRVEAADHIDVLLNNLAVALRGYIKSVERARALIPLIHS
jgi:hypothetical protein